MIARRVILSVLALTTVLGVLFVASPASAHAPYVHCQILWGRAGPYLYCEREPLPVPPVPAPPSNQPPVASFTHSCDRRACTFDASGSYDPDGWIPYYWWDFGDGTTGGGSVATHAYGAGGTYAVTLTVGDNGSAYDSETRMVTVEPNQPPTASFTYSCTGRTCSFDGSGSSDPDGSVASYGWDMGDGSTNSGRTVVHTYQFPGTYTVTLTATDAEGMTAAQSQQVTASNLPPTATFVYSCTRLTCSFDGSASADTDGSITTYSWTFGDGASGAGAQITHTYAKAGTYTVTLTVTDNDGGQATASQEVKLKSGGPRL